MRKRILIAIVVLGSGTVVVQKLTIVVDAGSIVHPDGALAQVEGGALWGLSMALREGTEFVNGQVKDAIDAANSLPVAFQASIFTENLRTAFHAAERLDAATVMVNDHTAFRTDWMPFAGRRQSGYGIGGIPGRCGK